MSFSNFEKRKRNLKFLSPVSRREREIWTKVLNFREEKEKGIFFSEVSRGEREFFNKSPISRRKREIWNSFPHFWEEKEKFGKGFSTFETRKRNGYYFLKIREVKENSYQAFWKVFPFSKALPNIFLQPKWKFHNHFLLRQDCDFSSNAMHKSWQLLLLVRAYPGLKTTLLK